MSCLTQHKTKEELSNWLMENASDNETTGFLDMLAGDIWDMMNAESEEIKKLKKEHIQNIMKTKSIATELYREVKYSLGYGEFDEPDRKVMYDDIKKLKEENKKLERANEINADLHKTMEETIGELENEIKKLKEENKKLQLDYATRGDIVEGLKETIKKLKEREFRMCEIANANGWDIYPTDSEEEDDIEDNDPEEYGEYTWKEGLTAEEIKKQEEVEKEYLKKLGLA